MVVRRKSCFAFRNPIRLHATPFTLSHGIGMEEHTCDQGTTPSRETGAAHCDGASRRQVPCSHWRHPCGADTRLRSHQAPGTRVSVSGTPERPRCAAAVDAGVGVVWAG